MAQDDGVNERGREFRNEECGRAGRHEQKGEQRHALPAVRQRAARIITERQRNQHHANLADPHVKRAAEILGQISRADDFEHHHRETAQENQAGGGQFAHDPTIAVDAVRREGKWLVSQFGGARLPMNRPTPDPSQEGNSASVP
ncbi:MAG: hypothetical protein DME22_19830, partial [Verrucomicrobia bacterium]